MSLRNLSACALAVLVLVGCGTTTAGAPTNPTSGGPTGPTVPKLAVQLIAAADALCKTAHGRQGAVHGRANKKTTAAQLVPLLRAQAGIAKGLAASLGKLSPPAETSGSRPFCPQRGRAGHLLHSVGQLDPREPRVRRPGPRPQAFVLAPAGDPARPRLRLQGLRQRKELLTLRRQSKLPVEAIASGDGVIPHRPPGSPIRRRRNPPLRTADLPVGHDRAHPGHRADLGTRSRAQPPLVPMIGAGPPG